MQSYYAARAAEYDRIYAKPERQADLRRLERTLPPLFAGRRTIEIACGTGYWTRFIAAEVSEVVGIDAAPETLAIARRRAPSARCFVADAYDLPAELGMFEAAFAGFWFSHVPRRRWREFLDGLQGRLLPGATVVFLDNRYVEGSSTPIADIDGDGDSYQIRRLQDGSTHRVLKNFPTAEELTRVVEALGADLRFDSLDYYWILRYRTRK